MKKIIAIALAAVLALGCFMMTGCGANDEIISEFVRSGKDIATLNLREGRNTDSKAAGLRAAVRRLGVEEQVVVLRRGGNIVLIRKERMKALGL